VLCWVMRMVTANFLLMITVGLVCLNLYNAPCSLEMIGIRMFFKYRVRQKNLMIFKLK